MVNLMDSASQTFIWNVSQPSVSLSSPGNQTGYNGDAVSINLSASSNAGHTLTYSNCGILPSGLSLNSSTGAITGTISTGASGFSPYSVPLPEMFADIAA